MLPRPLRRLPADLAAVLAMTIATMLIVLLPGVRETPLRVIVGLPFVLFLPGYAFIAALFPEQGPTDAPQSESESDAGVLSREEGIDGIERVALSFGTSIAIVPLIGLVLNFTPWGIRLLPVLVSVSGFTLVATVIAAVRRWELPPDERFAVPYLDWYATGRSELLEPKSRTDAALNVLLVLSILLAIGSIGYTVGVPKQGEAFTEFYLLTENETGALVADGYPTEFEQGEAKPLVVGIGNQEHKQVEYSVVVTLQRVEVANNSTTVLEERKLDQFARNLAHNETWMTERTVAPTMIGKRLRLQFLLYRDTVPDSPTEANSYRELHLWINVSAPDQTALR